jgi:pyridoxamine 5'-phosphate oxidase-like protein
MPAESADLDRLQALLDDSIARASPFLRSSFEMPAHSLSAAQLTAHLRGSFTVALASVTARGEPRVTPIAALFAGGSFYVPTVAEAARARHFAARPGASLTYFEGTDLAVIAHGHVTIVREGDPEFAEVDARGVAAGNQSPREWAGEGVYLRLRPAVIYTYARDPGRIGAGVTGER